jgi:hypothetical protein
MWRVYVMNLQESKIVSPTVSAIHIGSNPLLPRSHTNATLISRHSAAPMVAPCCHRSRSQQNPKRHPIRNPAPCLPICLRKVALGTIHQDKGRQHLSALP